MTIQFSPSSYKALKLLGDADVQKLVVYHDDNETVTIADEKEFDFALFEAIPHFGMTNDFQEVTPYGRELYNLLDEFQYYMSVGDEKS